MVAVEFARFFGAAHAAFGDLTEVTNAVCATAAYTHVALGLVDEIHGAGGGVVPRTLWECAGADRLPQEGARDRSLWAW
jgi:hypothetical protein